MIDLNPFVFEIVVLCWADKESPFWRGVWSVVLKKDDVNMQVLFKLKWNYVHQVLQVAFYLNVIFYLNCCEIIDGINFRALL